MTTNMTTKQTAERIAPLAIDLTIVGRLDVETRQTILLLAHALEHQHGRCDAIGECGHKCSLRAGHPGSIHEECRWGTSYRFRLDGPVLCVS